MDSVILPGIRAGNFTNVSQITGLLATRAPSDNTYNHTSL